MSSRFTGGGSGSVAPAARVFSSLQADDALLPGRASRLRKSGAILLALLMLAAVPLFWAAQGVGLIGDVPAAVAKGGALLGPDEDEWLGPADDFDDERTFFATDSTSANNRDTRGTTRDRDTLTHPGTNDTSGAKSTRGTTRDNDTRTTATNTGGGGGTNTNSNTG